MTHDLYPHGQPIHAFASLSNKDAAFSFFDDQGTPVTFAIGDRIVVDGGLFVQGSSPFPLTVYFDDGNQGVFNGQHTLFEGMPRISGNASAFIRGNSQAGANGAQPVVNGAGDTKYAPSVRWAFGAANGATVMIFGRRITT